MLSVLEKLRLLRYQARRCHAHKSIFPGVCPQVSDAEAEREWRFWYDFSATHCTHGKTCANLKRGQGCTYGMRIQKTQLITGAHPPGDLTGRPSGRWLRQFLDSQSTLRQSL
jgi:hypothetical protein